MKAEELIIGMDVVYFNPLPQRSVVERIDEVPFVKIKNHRSPVCLHFIEEYLPGNELEYAYKAIERKMKILKTSLEINPHWAKDEAGELLQTINHFTEMLDGDGLHEKFKKNGRDE